MNWQAAAAWVGAGLGTLNFCLAILAKRPICQIVALRRSGECDLYLQVTNLSKRNVLLRSLSFWPADNEIAICALDDADSPRESLERSYAGRFGTHLTLIEPKASSSAMVAGITPQTRGMFVVRWTDQKTIFPWSFMLLTRKLAVELCALKKFGG